MGFHGTHSRKIGKKCIERTSLQLHFDMRPISYPGTGLIWNNLAYSTTLFGSSNSMLLVGTTYDNVDGLVFNGSSSYGRLSFKLAYPFTISVWVMTGVIATQLIAGYYSSSDNSSHHDVRFSSNGKIGVFSETTVGGEKGVDSLISYNRNQWYNVVGVFNSVGRSIFVNGKLEGVSNVAVAMSSSLDRFSIGAFDRPSIGVWVNGKIKNCLVYSRELTATEILHNYNALK